MHGLTKRRVRNIKIKKVLNSSVVLAVDDKQKDCILLGQGIGYGKKSGEVIKKTQVDQIFIPLSNPDARHMLELFSSIPPVYLELTQAVVTYANEQLASKMNEHIYLVLTDHLHFAVERIQKGIVVSNRIFWEIKKFYPKEYAIGEHAVSMVNERLQVELPPEEAANIAFHLVNSQRDPDVGYDAMQAAKIMGEISDIVNCSMHYRIDLESIHYARFLTHVQFFAERFLEGKLLDSESIFLFEQLRPGYPEAISIAEKVGAFFLKIYQTVLPDEEIAYLAVYVARLMQERQ